MNAWGRRTRLWSGEGLWSGEHIFGQIRQKGKNNEQSIRVAFYIRVSTDKDDQINSFENQRDACQITLSQHPEYSLVKIYQDEGITGTSARKRPGFMEMIRDANVIPENVRLIVNDAVLSPLASSFLGLLNTFAGLMIFLTICSGILGIGDSATLGRMGTSVVARFIVLLFAISAMSAIVVLPFVSLNTSSVGQERTSAFGQISRMFFDILPSNMIDPFRTGNTFQIIVIAAFTGCALLAIGERGSRVRGLIGEASILFQKIVSSVCALVPLFVFGMLLQLIWSGQVYVLSFAFKQIILIVFFDIALTMTAWIISSLRLKCPPILLLKKVLPVFLVAFTSASSVSAFQIGMETCERELGVDRHLTSFIYPLGSVIFMPTSVVYFTVLVCTFAETYQIPVNASWLIMAVMMSALIAIAMPPVPGADILCHSVLFSGLGIPAEAIILATAASIAIDHLDTGTNVMVMIFQIVCEAKRLDKLDRGILLGKVKGTAM